MGIWVTAKVVRKFTIFPQFRAIWNEVMTYVHRSARTAAQNMETPTPAPAFLTMVQMSIPHRGPKIPMEKMLAPSVVIPPWERRIAWNMRTIVSRNDVAQTPYRTADSPVPVGCELDPVTDGILREDNKNMNAPESATVSSARGEL